MKLNDKKLYLRNNTNSNLSNYTTSFRSYSIIDNKKNIFKEIEKKVLNPNYHLIFTSKNSKGNNPNIEPLLLELYKYYHLYHFYIL